LRDTGGPRTPGFWDFGTIEIDAGVVREHHGFHGDQSRLKFDFVVFGATGFVGDGAVFGGVTGVTVGETEDECLCGGRWGGDVEQACVDGVPAAFGAFGNANAPCHR
jgi:hypothetical protein